MERTNALQHTAFLTRTFFVDVTWRSTSSPCSTENDRIDKEKWF